MVEGGVDLTEGSLDRVVVWRWGATAAVGHEGGEWTKQTYPQLDQEHAELEPQRSQAVASGGADAFDEPFGTQLGQVVAQLAEAVVGLRQLMAGQDAGVQLTGRPVRGKGGGMQQRLQHTDQAVIVQLQARDSALPDHGRPGQRRQLAAIDGARQQLRLERQAALIGRRQLLAQEGQILQSAPNAKMTGIVRAGFVAQDAISVLITAGVELGE